MTPRGECGFGGSLNCSVCHCLLRSLFSMFISTSVFSMFASSSVFFNVYAFLCFLSYIDLGFFSMFCITTCFLMFMPISFFSILYMHLCFFNVCIDICFFNVYANLVFFNDRSTTICICFPEVEVLKTVFGVFVAWDKY